MFTQKNPTKNFRFRKALWCLTSSVFKESKKKRSKNSKWMLLLLKNPASSNMLPPPLLVPLFHFLTLVFSSSLFRLPQSQEFAQGQKAAAEAQPIWNAAPPSWRSDRERHEDGCNASGQIHKLFICKTNTLDPSRLIRGQLGTCNTLLSYCKHWHMHVCWGSSKYIEFILLFMFIAGINSRFFEQLWWCHATI